MAPAPQTGPVIQDTTIEVMLEFEELSYASPDDPAVKRWVIHVIEHLSGRPKLLPIYREWRKVVAAYPESKMRALLEMLEVRPQFSGSDWPPRTLDERPLVMIANHPFGIGDGLTMLAMAEEIGRPYRVFVDYRLLKIPEIRPFALPIDQRRSREAMRITLRSREQLRAFLIRGHTVVIFPAGAVATALLPWGPAHERPWKNFAARLVQGAKASVLPVYFKGQNSPLFHFVSQLSLTLRLSLLVSEFIRRFRRSEIRVAVGDIVPFDRLRHTDNGNLLTAEMFDMVQSLAHDDTGAIHPSAPSSPEFETSSGLPLDERARIGDERHDRCAPPSAREIDERGWTRKS